MVNKDNALELFVPTFYNSKQTIKYTLKRSIAQILEVYIFLNPVSNTALPS